MTAAARWLNARKRRSSLSSRNTHLRKRWNPVWPTATTSDGPFLWGWRIFLTLRARGRGTYRPSQRKCDPAIRVPILGSQCRLGPVPYAEDLVKMSAEADIAPLNAPERADRRDRAIGEGSPSMNSTATTHRAWVRTRRSLQKAGWIDCTVFRTKTPMAAWATAWTWSISFGHKRQLPGRRTGFSASRSANTAM